MLVVQRSVESGRFWVWLIGAIVWWWCMDSDVAGEILRWGIEEDRFWIFTHPEWVDTHVADKIAAMAKDGTLPDF